MTSLSLASSLPARAGECTASTSATTIPNAARGFFMMLHLAQ
jgi:hypothetical protein